MKELCEKMYPCLEEYRRGSLSTTTEREAQDRED